MTVAILEDNTAAIDAQWQIDAADTRRAFAERIKGNAAEAAPVDTSALSVSGYITDENGSDYDAAVSAAQGKNPKAEMLPEVAAERDSTIIAFAAAYAAINELTNVAFLSPAVEAERPAFEALGGRIT